MKHTYQVTLLLIGIFLFSQLIGSYTYAMNIPVVLNETTGEIMGTEQINSSMINVPESTEEEQWGFILHIMVGVLIATGLIFLLKYLKLIFVFKYWFLLAIFAALSMSISMYLENTLGSEIALYIALGVGLVLALWRVFKPNFYIQNITELMIYTGIAIALAEFFVGNILAAALLLIGISVYDAIAVWKSKHMIKLAEVQTESGVFAGLSIPYSNKKIEFRLPKKLKSGKGEKIATAVLGGGDIAFPLLFTAVTVKFLVDTYHIMPVSAFLYSTIISILTTIALGLLLFKSEKGKFYPAMPFITAGCFIGYGLMMILVVI